jgi:hypothetical protein
LAPSDFQPFGPLKEALGGRRFRCDKDVKNVAQQRLLEQAQTFHCDGIKKLLGLWERCVAKQSDYVGLVMCFVLVIIIKIELFSDPQDITGHYTTTGEEINKEKQ